MVLLTWPMASMSPQRIGMRSTWASFLPSLMRAPVSAAHAHVVRAGNPFHQIAVRRAGSGGIEFDAHRSVALRLHAGSDVDHAAPAGGNTSRTIRSDDLKPLVAQRADCSVPGTIEG